MTDIIQGMYTGRKVGQSLRSEILYCRESKLLQDCENSYEVRSFTIDTIRVMLLGLLNQKRWGMGGNVGRVRE
jgi:hypothetical protein